MNPKKTSCIDLILTNYPRFFQNSCVMETGLSDFQKMFTTVMKAAFRKMEPKVIKHCDYKFFCDGTFRESLQNMFLNNLKSDCDMTITTILLFLAKTFLIRLLYGKRSMWAEIIRHLWIKPYQKQLW